MVLPDFPPRPPLSAMKLPVSVIVTAIAFIGACWAADIRTRRIPNALSALAGFSGIILNAVCLGLPGVVHGLLGVVLVVAVLLAPFLLGGVGGGDVKMMAALGALLGPFLALASLGMGMALGGVLMVVHLVRLGRFREKAGATARMIWHALTTLSAAPLRVPAADVANAVTLPYSVPLGLGTVTVLGLVWRG
jgi:prepilin peptidase CpaA